MTHLTHKVSVLLTREDYLRFKNAIAWEDRRVSEFTRDLLITWTDVMYRTWPQLDGK